MVSRHVFEVIMPKSNALPPTATRGSAKISIFSPTSDFQGLTVRCSPEHAAKESGGAKNCEVAVNKGLHIVFQSLDADHVLARIVWREQDIGGGALSLEIPVRSKDVRDYNLVSKTDIELQADARALAARFARAFADTIES